jgi:hypothetical protein
MAEFGWIHEDCVKRVITSFRLNDHITSAVFTHGLTDFGLSDVRIEKGDNIAELYRHAGDLRTPESLALEWCI